MISKASCINIVRKNKCKRLVVDVCLGDNCSFRQTENQEMESRKVVFKRLATLDRELQLYIADKYYGGDMPWDKGGRSYDY